MGVLTGIRIVELAGLGPAPFAAMMLADHGADVLRIHALQPRRGIPSLDTHADVLARGRDSVAVDLKSREGQDLVLDMVAQADGFIEGFRPGVAERLGLGPADCLARNARLVYGRMTGWGQSGPLALRAGHDINYLALSGALNAIGTAERPCVPLNLVSDFGGGGMFLAFGMLAGILHARSGGHGQVVDAAMIDGSAILTTLIHGLRAAEAWKDARECNLLDGGAYFYGVYPCQDDRFLAVGAIEPQFHHQFLKGLGLDAAEFDQMDASGWEECRRRVAEAFARHPRAYWLRVFAESDACVTPVLNWEEAIAHPHNKARAAYINVGGIVQPAPAPRFVDTPPQTPSPAGLPGDATPSLLSRWGIFEERSTALLQAGVLARWQ